MKKAKQGDNSIKWILGAVMIVFLFFVSASTYNLTLQVDDLIQIEGKVASAEIEEETGQKGRTIQNLYIYLAHGGRYKIMDDMLFEKYRQEILEKVKDGDEVTLYIRTEHQADFGLGTTDLIYQLEHGGEILMPLSVMKTNYWIIIAILMSVFIFMTVYAYSVRIKD